MTNINETTEKKLPTHLIYIVTTKEDGAESNWLKVGAAWPTKGGKGFNIVLEHLLNPNKHYVMIENNPKPKS